MKSNKKGVTVGHIIIIIALIAFMLYAIGLKFITMQDFPDTLEDSVAISNSYHSYVELHDVLNDIAKYSYDFALFDFTNNGALSSSNTVKDNIYLSGDKHFLGYNKWIYYSDVVEDQELGREEESTEEEETPYKLSSPSEKYIGQYSSNYYNTYLTLMGDLYEDYIFPNASFSAKIKKKDSDYQVVLSDDEAASIPIFDKAMIYESYKNINLDIASGFTSSKYDAGYASVNLFSPLAKDYKFDTFPIRRDTIVLTSCFGDRTVYIGNQGTKCHGGIDIRASANELVYSVESGVVDQVQRTGTTTYIRIRHNNGLYTRYLHVIALPNINIGDSVTKGQAIAKIEPNGNHLHFEVNVPVSILDISQYNDRDFCTSQEINPSAIIRRLNSGLYALDPLAFFTDDIRLTKKDFSNCADLSDYDFAERASRYLFLLPESDERICLVSNLELSQDKQDQISEIMSYENVLFFDEMPSLSYDCDFIVYSYESSVDDIMVYHAYPKDESIDILCENYANLGLTKSNICSVEDLNRFTAIDSQQILDNKWNLIGIRFSERELESRNFDIVKLFEPINKAIYAKLQNSQDVETGKDKASEIIASTPEDQDKGVTISSQDDIWDFYTKDKSTLFYRYDFELYSDFDFDIIKKQESQLDNMIADCIDDQDVAGCISQHLSLSSEDFDYSYKIDYDGNELSESNKDFISKLYKEKLHIQSAYVLSQLIACYKSDDLFCDCFVNSPDDLEVHITNDGIMSKYSAMPEEFSVLSQDLKTLLLDSYVMYDLSNFEISEIFKAEVQVSFTEGITPLRKLSVNNLNTIDGLEITPLTNLQECDLNKKNFIFSKNTKKIIEYADKNINIELTPLLVYAVEFKNNIEPLQPEFIVTDLEKAEDSILIEIMPTDSTDVKKYNIYIDDILKAEIYRDDIIMNGNHYDETIIEESDDVIVFDNTNSDFIFDLDQPVLKNIAEYSYTIFRDKDFVSETKAFDKDHLYIVEDDPDLRYVVVLADVEDGTSHDIKVEAVDYDDFKSDYTESITPIDDLAPGKPEINADEFNMITIISNNQNEDGSKNTDVAFAEIYIGGYLGEYFLTDVGCSNNIDEYTFAASVPLDGGFATYSFESYKNVLALALGIDVSLLTQGTSYCIAVIALDKNKNPVISKYDEESYYTDLVATKKVALGQSFLG